MVSRAKSLHTIQDGATYTMKRNKVMLRKYGEGNSMNNMKMEKNLLGGEKDKTGVGQGRKFQTNKQT